MTDELSNRARQRLGIPGAHPASFYLKYRRVSIVRVDGNNVDAIVDDYERLNVHRRYERWSCDCPDGRGGGCVHTDAVCRVVATPTTMTTRRRRWWSR